MNPTDLKTLSVDDITDSEFVISHNSQVHISRKISVKELIDYVAQEATKKVVENLKQ